MVTSGIEESIALVIIIIKKIMSMIIRKNPKTRARQLLTNFIGFPFVVVSLQPEEFLRNPEPLWGSRL
jgi:hypothetical protein